MTKFKIVKALHTALALSLPLTFTAAPVLFPTAVAAGTLPSPYVSRALDAVLLPVTADVIAAFGLAADETGVLVLATDPTGVAATSGIEPGDVINLVHGKPVSDPITLDEIVYYWIQQGAFDFAFNGWRAGTAYSSNATITLESWTQVIEVTTIETWSAYSYESFSYSEFYAEYSTEISESYASSETTIEESITSEEFTSEMTSEETVTEEAVAEDTATDEAASDEAANDEAAADDGQDGGDAVDDGGDAGGDEPADDAGDSGDDGGDGGDDVVEE